MFRNFMKKLSFQSWVVYFDYVSTSLCKECATRLSTVLVRVLILTLRNSCAIILFCAHFLHTKSAETL